MSDRLISLDGYATPDVPVVGCWRLSIIVNGYTFEANEPVIQPVTIEEQDAILRELTRNLAEMLSTHLAPIILWSDHPRQFTAELNVNGRSVSHSEFECRSGRASAFIDRLKVGLATKIIARVEPLAEIIDPMPNPSHLWCSWTNHGGLPMSPDLEVTARSHDARHQVGAMWRKGPEDE